MRQWEDMRDTTGVMDFFAELTMDVDDIRDDANRGCRRTWSPVSRGRRSADSPASWTT
jgi:hypothetical protein